MVKERYAVVHRKDFLSMSFDIINVFLLTVLMIAMIYPFIYVFSVSVSDQSKIAEGAVKLYPVGFNLEAYKTIFRTNDIIQAYKNSVIYTFLGSLFATLVACLTAYPLSRKSLRGKKALLFLFTLTMFTPPGMIPSFLVINSLGMIDTLWAIILPPAFMMFYILIMITGFKGVPESLIESAYIDGANDWIILFRIMIPLSSSIVATICLFTAVMHWNNFFAPLLYLNRPDMFPLQIILRKIVLQSNINTPIIAEMTSNYENNKKVVAMGPGFAQAIKMAAVIVTIGPIILIYPFAQKYFVKGVTLGSVKG